MQMDSSVAVLAALGAILLGAISPGPSFVLVARTAVAVSRRDALATALGMGAGGREAWCIEAKPSKVTAVPIA
jgi:threonine/homoserine/homoserine lactone efflux protein